MIAGMTRPLAYITTPPASFEERVKHLHIPKARQKELLKIIEETRQRLAAEDKALLEKSLRPEEAKAEEKAEIASAAR